jgi:hypothetical protein
MFINSTSIVFVEKRDSMFSGLDLVFGAMSITLSTVCLGGLFLLIVWTSYLVGGTHDRSENIPAGLLTFTASVLIDVIAFSILSITPDDIKVRIWLLLLATSFALLVSSTVLLRRGHWQGRLILRIGAFIIVGLNILCGAYFFAKW